MYKRCICSTNNTNSTMGMGSLHWPEKKQAVGYGKKFEGGRMERKVMEDLFVLSFHILSAPTGRAIGMCNLFFQLISASSLQFRSQFHSTSWATMVRMLSHRYLIVLSHFEMLITVFISQMSRRH